MICGRSRKPLKLIVAAATNKDITVVQFYTFGAPKTPIFGNFGDRDSAEASAEASVDVAEASVSAESQFTPIRSFTSSRFQSTVTFQDRRIVHTGRIMQEGAILFTHILVQFA